MLRVTLRMLLAGLLLTAAIAKITTWNEFSATVRAILSLPGEGRLTSLSPAW
jgi:hypothetical protein